MIANNKIISISLGVMLIAVGAFYFATIREGIDWGGDSALYLLHAKNISAGVDYGKTAYIYNPFLPEFSPRIGPPVFPFLLASVYKFFGLNLTVMKIETIIFFLLALFLIFKVFKKELPSEFFGIILIAALGFNPYFWDFKDTIYSEFPFLFFLYLSILAVNKLYRSDAFEKRSNTAAVWLSILFYLCYGIRGAGFLLIPALFIYELFRFKKISSFFVKVVILFTFFVLAQNICLGHDPSFYGIFKKISPQTIFVNLFSYIKNFSILWDNGYFKAIRGILFIIFSVVAFVGCFANLKKRKVMFWEIFTLVYILAIICYPLHEGHRFLMPIMPVYMACLFMGISRVNLYIFKNNKNILIVLLCFLILATYVSKYTSVNWGAVNPGTAKKESVELFNYIKENTDKKDVFIFNEPRVLSLFTERRASTYHKPDRYEDLWKYFEEIGATDIILTSFDPYDLYLRDFIKKYIDSFRKIYFNTDFKVYRIIKYPAK